MQSFRSAARDTACWTTGVVLACLTAALGAASAADTSTSPDRATAANAPSYDRDIRPLLSDRCFRCHGPDEAAREANLRLDTFEGATAVRSDRPAVVPFELEQSELWRRVSHSDPGERMPPESSHKRPFDEQERALLASWIEAGAPYAPHWSFVAPRRPAVPAPRGAERVASPIDAFVLERLEREGLEPSPRAEKEQLLRRVFLDLTGLPPSLEELDRFLGDDAPDAYRRMVARLLHEEPYQSRYAERMASTWLDAARYADTSGIHTDAGRSIWPWRDWVLAAYRDGMPFDQFLIEQLAGDLLPASTLAQQVATGFNRNHVTTDEGGAIDAEYLVEYAVDRVSTTSSVFLGLTMACARCHDHKYDPLTQRDFYGLLACFNSIEEPGLYSQLPDPKRAFEPFLDVPSPAQAAERERLSARLESARQAAGPMSPAEQASLQRFPRELERAAGIAWSEPRLVRAEATGNVELVPEPDGALVARGPVPDQVDYTLEFATDRSSLRLLSLEALADPVTGRPGRAGNGNAVVSGIELEVRSEQDPTQAQQVELEWCWADVEQTNEDYSALNALRPVSGDATSGGWALDGHNRKGSRALVCLAREPFGFPGGSRITLRILQRSIYAQHSLARVRVALSPLAEAGLGALGLARGFWYQAGPFETREIDDPYGHDFGPEKAALDPALRFGAQGGQAWRYAGEFKDGELNRLPGGVNVSYVARRLLVPSRRKLELSLGSDDGLCVFVDGVERFSRRVERGLAKDQDRLELELERGEHLLVLKIVNTGGEAGFFYREVEPEPHAAPDTAPRALEGALVAAFLPERALEGARGASFEEAWRLRFSEAYREHRAKIAALEAEQGALERAIPRTMVMREKEKPTPTFVLVRGQYDQPDPARPVERAIPALFGAWPADLPRNRLGFARWLASAENPLVARVAVNRLWELVFGTGIVRSSEDFGLQGEFPDHPELLDWLAVEYRESGWDTKALLELLVTSNTYQQSSRLRPELEQRDPSNRLLACMRRRRLSAEQLRDAVLSASGLLVERFGGPSVKPYQPEGLWTEVAMPASNTRFYERGTGEDLWRRSLYTYWKRASPPPAMLALDAPTREVCSIRRTVTNTPLQALALWNDPQWVEAARALAQSLLEAPGTDEARIARAFRRVISRAPEPAELRLLEQALVDFRARFAGRAEDAESLLSVGEAPRAQGLDATELAAWTLLVNAVFASEAALVVG